MRSPCSHDKLWGAPALGALEWPAELEVDALLWIRDELLAPHVGSVERAWSVLRGGYHGTQWPHPRSLGMLAAKDREAFLRTARVPAPSLVLDTVSFETTFARVLSRFSAAEPNEDLLLLSR